MGPLPVISGAINSTYRGLLHQFPVDKSIYNGPITPFLPSRAPSCSVSVILLKSPILCGEWNSFWSYSNRKLLAFTTRNTPSSWQFCELVTFSLDGEFTWPFQTYRIHLGLFTERVTNHHPKKVTLNHLVRTCWMNLCAIHVDIQDIHECF